MMAGLAKYWCWLRFRGGPKLLWTIFGGGGTLVVALSSIYFTAFQIFGNDWAWFKNNKTLHSGWSIVAMILCAIISFGQWICEKKLRESRAGSEQLLISFHGMVAAIVANKAAQLSAAAASMTQKRFVDLVAPDQQITKIMTEGSSFLSGVFGLSENQLDITILQKNGLEGNWNFYRVLRQGWAHDGAANFMAPGCAAFHALDSGQYFLLPSKQRASNDGRYRLSKRDRESGDGSIFCNPLAVSCKGSNSHYVISIVTYGKRLCEWGDDENLKKVEGLLREISRRLELELILKTIKAS